MNNMGKVPNMISCKDLDYLSDMFEWNYECFKNTSNSVKQVSDDSIKNMLERGVTLFNNNMNQVIEILGGSYE